MTNSSFHLEVSSTKAVCAIGETVGRQNIADRAVPVLSCEGACIRGEIARLAANALAQAPGYRRACHGELFAVPRSAMAQWVHQADRVVVIDGCHLHCHGRIVEHLVPADRLRSFDAQAHHRRYCDIFAADDVPPAERQAVADDVARWVGGELSSSATPTSAAAASSRCGCTP
jgi:uncharacterized metal-binding protein